MRVTVEEPEAMQAIEDAPQLAVVNLIQEIPASDFDCPVVHTPHRISLVDAQARFLDALRKSKSLLPKDMTPESVVAGIRAILIPGWLIAADLEYQWSATGTKYIQKRQPCKCQNNKRPGWVRNKRCDVCGGRGYVAQQKAVHDSVIGVDTAKVSKLLKNDGSGIDLNVEYDRSAQWVSLTHEQLSNFTCVFPVTTDSSNSTKTLVDAIENDVCEKAKAKVRKDYSGFSDFRLESDGLGQWSVKAWLYPAYICWFETKGKKMFCVCDAVTGKVALPTSFGRRAKRLFSLLLKAVGVAFGLFFLLALIAAIFDTRDPASSKTVLEEKQDESAKSGVPPIPQSSIEAKAPLVVSAVPAAPQPDAQVVREWHDAEVGLKQAYQRQIMANMDMLAAISSANRDQAKFFDSANSKCGLVPEVYAELFDSGALPSADADVAKILRCHLELVKEQTAMLKRGD